jgi:ribosome recycling factor
MSKGEYKQIEEKMKKTISVLKQELSRLRAGRANPAILDKVTVDYYGAPTPINQLANISIPEARLIVIQPWDVNTLKDIEKAIQKSDIGIHPNNDGKVIRLVFPILTEERRKELTKVVKKLGEDSKIAISFTNFLNSSFLAAKSVSIFTSTRTPILPSPWIYESTIPSAAILPDFFAAAARPFSLKYSTALSISPLVSTRAFLQSIIPAPTFSLSCFTISAVIIKIPPNLFFCK